MLASLLFSKAKVDGGKRKTKQHKNLRQSKYLPKTSYLLKQNKPNQTNNSNNNKTNKQTNKQKKRKEKKRKLQLEENSDVLYFLQKLVEILYV